MDEFRSLPVFRQAYALCLSVFHATNAPYDTPERPLFDDLRRASLRVCGIIARGHAIQAERPFHHSLGKALGVAVQVNCLLAVAAELEYVSGKALTRLRPQISSLISRLTELVRNPP